MDGDAVAHLYKPGNCIELTLMDVVTGLKFWF